MREKELLIQQRKDYIAAVRQYVRSQKHLWNQIPYWAFKADGRIGYRDSLASAYEDKKLPLDSSVSSGGYTAWVDLATAELVQLYPGKLALDTDVARLEVEELDAEKILHSLKLLSTEPFFNKTMEAAYQQRMASQSPPSR